MAGKYTATVKMLNQNIKSNFRRMANLWIIVFVYVPERRLVQEVIEGRQEHVRVVRVRACSVLYERQARQRAAHHSHILLVPLAATAAPAAAQ